MTFSASVKTNAKMNGVKATPKANATQVAMTTRRQIRRQSDGSDSSGMFPLRWEEPE